jgi:hypothetical protein
MRRCLQCRENFRAKRSDAEFCSPTCRKAAQRIRQKDDAALPAEVLKLKRKNAALAIFDRLDAIQHIARALHGAAKAAGVDVAFLPTPTGVVAVEGRPGEFEKAKPMIAKYPNLDRQRAADRASVDETRREELNKLVAWRKDEENRSDSGGVKVDDLTIEQLDREIERLRSALASRDDATAAIEAALSGSFVAREAAKAAQSALESGGNVIQLRARPDYIADRNRAASFRNQGATFLGVRGFRCSCTRFWDGQREWGEHGFMCCDTSSDTDIPDEPRGFPHPRNPSMSQINRTKV